MLNLLFFFLLLLDHTAVLSAKARSHWVISAFISPDHHVVLFSFNRYAAGKFKIIDGCQEINVKQIRLLDDYIFA